MWCTTPFFRNCRWVKWTWSITSFPIFATAQTKCPLRITWFIRISLAPVRTRCLLSSMAKFLVRLNFRHVTHADFLVTRLQDEKFQWKHTARYLVQISGPHSWLSTQFSLHLFNSPTFLWLCSAQTNDKSLLVKNLAIFEWQIYFGHYVTLIWLLNGNWWH